MNELIGFSYFNDTSPITVFTNSDGVERTKKPTRRPRGMQPIFRNVHDENHNERVQNNTSEAFFSVGQVVRRVHFIFSGKRSGNYKLNGIQVTYSSGEAPLDIGNIKETLDCQKRVVVLEPNQRIVGFKYTKPAENPFMLLQEGFCAIVSKISKR